MHAAIDTILGPLTIEERDGQIVALKWGVQEHSAQSPLLEEAGRQLHDYFAGRRQCFDLPLAPRVSSFEKQVLDQMIAIPFGETRTYGDLARRLETQPQAIGQACGANPIPIIIPCHRVLAASGLGGFSAPGGIETKIKLLKHEGAAGLLL